MQDTITEREVEELSLLDSLEREWIKLPLTIMQDVGPAVQTLGGLLKITNRGTFVPVEDIADNARVPLATCRKHLVRLHEQGWIDHQGRQETRGGHLRRTATIKITKQTRAHIEPYSVLPWWACGNIRRVGRLPWSAKSLLSVVMAKLMALKAVVEREDGSGNLDADEMIGSIENLGGDDRFKFSLRDIRKKTGLAWDSIIRAKRWLHTAGIVEWSKDVGEHGEGLTDRLAVNWDFRVVVTPAGPGRCYLDFR